MAYPFSSHSNLTVLKRMLIKTIKMYLLWSVIYMPITIYIGYGPVKSLPSFLKWYLEIFLFYGSHFGNSPLWYLLSVIYALIFIIVLNQMKVRNEIMLILGFVIGILLVLFLQYYYSNTDKMSTFLMHTFKNGRVLIGVFFLPCGIQLSRKQLSTFLSVAFFIGGLILCFATFLYNLSYLMYLPVSLYATGFFCLVLNMKISSFRNFLKLREISVWMYFIHIIVWTVLYLSISGKMEFGMIMFLLTLASSIAISTLIIKLEKYINKIF